MKGLKLIAFGLGIVNMTLALIFFNFHSLLGWGLASFLYYHLATQTKSEEKRK